MMSMNLRESGVNGEAGACVFCAAPDDKIVAQNRLAYALRDNAPVTRLHTLILPKRHASGYFDLAPEEKCAIDELIDRVRLTILADDPDVGGFNIGINIGKVAGQTIFHCHIHLIPRRRGDALHPEGGVHAAIRRVLGSSV
jgi:ATP adenylyltransferase